MGVEQLTAERQGGLMGFAPQMWGDDFGHVANPGSFGDEGNMTLRRNGEEIGYSYYPGGVFEVPAEDSAYELVESRDAIANTWRALPEVERKVLELRFMHDLTQREIGERIGYSQMHVSRLLRRALSRLETAAAAA